MYCFTRRSLLLPIFLTCIFFVVDIRASAIVRRDLPRDNAVMIITRAGNVMGAFPVLGPLTKNIARAMVSSINEFETATNGFLAKILAGILPCNFSLGGGLTCAGIEEHGGPGKILIDALRDVPSSTLPDLTKWMLELAIEHTLGDGSSLD